MLSLQFNDGVKKSHNYAEKLTLFSVLVLKYYSTAYIKNQDFNGNF